MYCKKCKITYHADEKFCRLCGEKLHARKKEKRNKQKSQQPVISNIYLLFGLGLAIFIIALLVIDRSGQQDTTMDPRPQPGKEVPATFTSAVYEVAEKFICPCGGCGEMALETCSCDMHHGAIEAKTFIQQQLNQGKSKDEVIATMIKRYGYLKTEYQKEYLVN